MTDWAIIRKTGGAGLLADDAFQAICDLAEPNEPVDPNQCPRCRVSGVSEEKCLRHTDNCPVEILHKASEKAKELWREQHA